MSTTIQFNPDFVLPELLLSLTRLDDSNLHEPGMQHSIQSQSDTHRFSLSFSNVNPKPNTLETEAKLVVVLGAPVMGDKIDIKAIAKLFAEKTEVSHDKLREINGEFLVVVFDKSTSTLSIVNDRFTSIPLYYHHAKQSARFLASTYFSSLWKIQERMGSLELDKNAFFEFLWFQRLLGAKTYLTDTYFMEDASVLTVEDQSMATQRYWRRSYDKSSLSLRSHAETMATLVRQSIKRKTSDNLRFGHFLSGGMDSRTVLCAFDPPPTCFTATIAENRELRKAREIAASRNAKHIALELAPDHYSQIFRHSTMVVGGMYNYDHGLFYGFENAVRAEVDACFHGHGFDYMFQGMYIPKENYVLGGKTLYANKLKELPSDLVEYFINNVSYRIKKADIWKYILEDKRGTLKEFQRHSVEEILEKGRQLTDNPYDLWEFLTFHHISRHYSYPNHASIATFVEQRTASFDNDLFDLYLSLPVQHRVNGKVEKACLKLLNPEIAAIWSANTNLPVTASCWEQTLYQVAGAVKRRIIPEPRKPEWMERTWPERDDAIRQQPALKDAVKKLCASDALEALDFLDLALLRKDIPEWLDGGAPPGVSGDLVQTLLTMGTFLSLR